MIISPEFVALDRVWFLTMRDVVSAIVETVIVKHGGTNKYKLFNWSGWFNEQDLHSTFADATKAWRNEIPNKLLDPDTKNSGDPDNNPRRNVDIFHAPML